MSETPHFVSREPFDSEATVAAGSTVSLAYMEASQSRLIWWRFLRHRVAVQSADQRQREIEPRRHPAAGHQIAILDDSRRHRFGADQRQQMGIGPMRRRALARQ